MPKVIQEAVVKKARSIGEFEDMAHDAIIDLNGLEKWMILNREFIDAKTNYRRLKEQLVDVRSRLNTVI